MQGAATIGEAPLAPLAAIWGERATGRIGGNVELINTGGGLSGDANVTLTDARFAGRQRGALTGRVHAHLEPNRLTASIDAFLYESVDVASPARSAAAPMNIQASAK